MEKGEITKRKRISTLAQKMKEKSPQKKNSFEVTQVRSSAELLQQYNIKREKIMAENKKASFQAQDPKDQTRNQPITIVEDAIEEQARTPKKKKKVQPMSLFQ